MNDSVREELRDKISPIVRLPEAAKPVMSPPPPLPFVIPAASATPAVATAPAIPEPEPIRIETAEIAAKQTSPTLVEFQAKSPALPDWRLELQNAVRKRREANVTAAVAAPSPDPAPIAQTAAATRSDVVAYCEPETGNKKLDSALKRIEQSRQRFMSGSATAVAVSPRIAEPVASPPPAPAPATKNYPFYIASKNQAPAPRPTDIKPALQRTIIEELPIIEKNGLDTNKLKPLPNSGIIAESLEKKTVDAADDIHRTDTSEITITRTADIVEDYEDLDFETETADAEYEETVEDLATLGMRFNAGIVDLLIGSCASLVLLAPLMMSGGNWYSLAGVLAFGVTCSIVMFIYLTTALGFFGQSLGMRLFSIEVLDIEEEDYPTLHQAAVNSSVYLVSLAFGGLGLIPALFNDEKRAAHDLLSGTIVVREEF